MVSCLWLIVNLSSLQFLFSGMQVLNRVISFREIVSDIKAPIKAIGATFLGRSLRNTVEKVPGMAYFTATCFIGLTIFIYGQEINGSSSPNDPITTEAAYRSVIDHYLSIQQSLHAQHIRSRNFTRIKPSRSVFNNYLYQLISLNRTSDIYKPVASDLPVQDEQQTSDPDPIQHGLSNFLLVLSSLSNRPLSDQSTNSSSGGIVSGGIAAVQETISQVGSSIQNGINSVFGSNQANEASGSVSWNPVRPISSAIASASSSQPAFCPTNCTMVCGLPQQAASLRVVGGTDVTPPNRYPWIALLQYYGQNAGTGTLINDRVVLTSGTIISSMVVFKQIKVMFGVYDPNSSATSPSVKIFSVTRTKLHPQYTTNNRFSYNIGLLQLAAPVTITDTFMPICLPNTVDNFSGAEAMLAGWGARELGGESWKSLQSVTIPLYSLDECQLAYPNATENNLCGGIFGPAEKEQHKTSCDGDDGAGLMYPWRNDPSYMTLIGIALQIPGVGCGRTNEPAIFTKLHAYIPWVRSQSSGCYCKA